MILLLWPLLMGCKPRRTSYYLSETGPMNWGSLARDLGTVLSATLSTP